MLLSLLYDQFWNENYIFLSSSISLGFFPVWSLRLAASLINPIPLLHFLPKLIILACQECQLTTIVLKKNHNNAKDKGISPYIASTVTRWYQSQHFDKGLLTYDKLFMTSDHYTFSQLTDQILWRTKYLDFIVCVLTR